MPAAASSFLAILEGWLAGASRMRWRHAALILTALFAVANWPLLTGQGHEQWDAYDLGMPYYSLVADCARAGHLLFWNPWLAGGSPDFAIAGAGALSPDMILLAALTGPGGGGYIAYWLLIWLAGGFGMLLLARHWRAPVWGGLVVALGYLFSGFYTGHAEHSLVVYSFSLLPWILWRLDVALQSSRWLPALQAGALWGLSGLAGYPSFTVCTAGLLGLWTVGRSLFSLEKPTAARCTRAFLRLLVVGLVGAVILAPSLISAVWEGRGYSDRGEPISRPYALESNALHPGSLVTLGSPAYGELKMRQPSLWSYTDVSCLSLYTGAATLLLALVSLGNRGERGWRWFLVTLALLALACAMSRTLPLRGWMYDLLPPTRFFRHSAMLRGYFIFLLSALALLGARDLARWKAGARALQGFQFLALFLAVCAFVGFGAVNAIALVGLPHAALTTAHLVIVWIGPVFLGLALARHFERWAPLAPGIFVLLAVLDLLATARLSQATVFTWEADPPQAHVSSLAPRFDRVLGKGQANSNVLARQPQLWNYTPLLNYYHHLITKWPPFSDMALGAERTWFSKDAPLLPPDNETFNVYTVDLLQLDRPVIIRHSRAGMLGQEKTPVPFDPAKVSAASRVPTVVREYAPEKMILEVEAPDDGWVMVTDRWSRSWQATVNGVAQPVEGANFIFRAVPVTRGANRIEFRFRPLGMPSLLIASWGALAFIGLATLGRGWRAAASGGAGFRLDAAAGELAGYFQPRNALKATFS